jgi:hypothetical protein
LQRTEESHHRGGLRECECEATQHPRVGPVHNWHCKSDATLNHSFK